jgi:hypothetical protein
MVRQEHEKLMEKYTMDGTDFDSALPDMRNAYCIT